MKSIEKEGKMNPKVSVIIPVWNPGEGITRCVESLRNQTLADIEMIFVDVCGASSDSGKSKSCRKVHA